MNSHFYDGLLDTVAGASRNSRWIFTAIVVVCLVQLGSAYNFIWSDTRSYVEDLVYLEGAPRTRIARRCLLIGSASLLVDHASRPGGVAPPASPAASAPWVPASGTTGAAVLDELRKKMVESWSEEQTFEIDLLGIRMHATDAGLMGSIAVLALSLWLLVAIHQEQRAVAHTLRLAAGEPEGLRAHVFHALGSARLFAYRPGDGAHGRRPAHPSRAAAIVYSIADKLRYLPVGTLVLMAMAEALNFFCADAVFRGRLGSLFEARGMISRSLVFAILVELSCAAAVWFVMHSVGRVQGNTRRMIQKKRRRGWARSGFQAGEAGELSGLAGVRNGATPPMPRVAAPSRGAGEELRAQRVERAARAARARLKRSQ